MLDGVIGFSDLLTLVAELVVRNLFLLEDFSTSHASVKVIRRFLIYAVYTFETHSDLRHFLGRVIPAELEAFLFKRTEFRAHK